MGSSGTCAGCNGDITLVEARPVVGTDGRVTVWCRACWPRREARARGAAVTATSPASSLIGPAPGSHPSPPRRPRRVTAIEVPPPPPRRRTTLLVAAAGLAIAAGAAVAVTRTAATTPRAPITVAASIAADVARAPAPAPAPAPAAPPIAPAAAPVAPAAEPLTDEGTADPAASVATQDEALDLATLEEERPSLLDWVHPVTGSDELVPVRGTRKFGARRGGLSRTLCGAGHCGVDLSGPRGRPVVAVAWGTVVRVEHMTRGRDGRSGRYVRIEHPERVFTSYMHLDAIAADIQVGDEVDAGTVIGTLGKTAIYHGEQHLHFGLEIEDRGAMLHVDPTPFLARAQIAPIPDQPLSLQPPADRAVW